MWGVLVSASESRLARLSTAASRSWNAVHVLLWIAGSFQPLTHMPHHFQRGILAGIEAV